MIFAILIWRLWMLVTAVLIFNVISRFVFSENKSLGVLFTSLFFVVFWPLAVFSPEGREYVSGRIINKL